MTVLCGCVYGVSHTTRRSLVRSQFFVQLLKIFKHGSEVPRSNKMLHTHVTFLFARVPAIIRTYTHTVSNCRVSRHVGLRKVIPVPLSDWTLSSVQICSRGYWLDNDKPVTFFVVKSAAFLLISSASNFKKNMCIGYAFSSCSKSMFLSTWGTKRPGSALWKEESCSSCVMQLIMSNIATYAKSQTCNYCKIVTIEILEHGNGDWASMNYAGTITEMLSGFSHAGCWHATGRLRNIQDDRQGNRQALLALEMCWRR